MPNTKQNNEISSNINEVIRSVLNYFFFFLQKDFTSTKKHKTAYSEQKNKRNTYKKHLRGKMLLIRLFAFCSFTWLCFYDFSAFGTFWCLVLFLCFLCL